MPDLTGLAATVVGGGVFGLATALQLARSGAAVTLYDPSPLGDNASGVAAGMLAPAMEAGLDPGAAAHFELLVRARDRWPAFLPEAAIDRSGALFVGPAAAAAALEARLRDAGAAVARLGPDQALDLSPGLALGRDDEALFAPQDWRLAPRVLLRTLLAAYRQAGGRVVAERVGLRDGRPAGRDGAPLAGDVVVLAAGAEAAELAGATPELAVLAPVKGQILHFEGGPAAGPVVRTPQGYVAPQGDGAAAGATMQPGLSDRRTDPAVLAGLRAEAERLFPGLAGVAAVGSAGVRATTPDGLPLVGRSAAAPDLLLCVGARRNGWLLAPLAAELTVATVTGGDTGDDGRILDPARFAAR
jgi:glycine oxidase